MGGETVSSLFSREGRYQSPIGCRVLESVNDFASAAGRQRRDELCTNRRAVAAYGQLS